MFRSQIGVLGVICIALASLCGLTSAQETTGTITGTVNDNSGAVIPAAEVVVRNTGTGGERRVASSANGEYVVTSLPVGSYEVTVEKQGFKRGSVGGVQLSVDQRL